MTHVSVVIPVYNVTGYVETAVQSVFNQTLSDLEIVIVDDGSTDGTAAALERIMGTAWRRSQKITVVSQSNRGASAARNTALREASGELVAFLDADDYWEPDYLATMVRELADRPELDAVFCGAAVISERGIHNIIPDRLRSSGIGIDDLVRGCGIKSASVVVCRRQAIVDAGYFDEEQLACSDLDLWLRMAILRKGNFGSIPDILVRYRKRSGQITSDWRKMITYWERAVAKARRRPNAMSRAAEQAGRCQLYIWLTKVAYLAGEADAALALLLQAWRLEPGKVARSLLIWRTTVKCLLNIYIHRRTAYGGEAGRFIKTARLSSG